MEFVINHVVLPPKLPQKDEESAVRTQGEKRLLQLVEETAAVYSEHCNSRKQRGWQPVLDALRNGRTLQKNPGVCKETLQKVFTNMRNTDAVALHLPAQNAGLLLFKTTDTVFVDAFEASPQNSDAMAANRLIRLFPGARVSFPSKLFGDKDFVDVFCSTLEKLHSEKVDKYQSTTAKAGVVLTEPRNTTNPALVTESLMSVLESLGRAEEFLPIQKATRDDVNFQDCLLPWRRSPFWLVTRVSIQLLLSRSFSVDEARIQSKNFMALLMARICSVSVEDKVDYDILSITTTKAARRLSKLGAKAAAFVTETVNLAVKTGQDHVKNSWKDFQERTEKTVERLESRASKNDTDLRLNNSRPHLFEAMKQSSLRPQSSDTQTLSPPPQMKFNEYGLPILHAGDNASNRMYILTDFESWVSEHLENWVRNRTVTDIDCAQLLQVMTAYKAKADALYHNSPQLQSIMLLKIMQLWTILDRACCKLYPMLLDYPPEIPETILEPLLLPHHSQMTLAHEIESHISNRQRQSNKLLPRILADPSTDSFSTRYYNQSPHHQRLRKAIESEAQNRRWEKEKELKKRNSDYEKLKEKARDMDHKYYISPYSGNEKHCKYCRKCEIDKEANEMSIDIDEWPLPEDEVHLKSAVFEAACPQGFAVWRDATWLILQQLARRQTGQGALVFQELLNYALLKKHLTDHHQLVVFGSKTKPFIRTHYKSPKLPATLKEVCLPNGLQYRLVVRNTNMWVAEQVETPTFEHRCSLQLPLGPYSSLQSFVNNVEAGPNQVLAQQTECNENISVHEFIAFGSLRCGERMQWFNILRELESMDLAPNCQEVSLLIRHAVMQLGTQETVLRKAHSSVRYPQFAASLLASIESHFTAVGANWKAQYRMATMAMLALRIMSLVEDDAEINRAISLLRKIRQRTLEWCRQLSVLLETAASEEYANKLGTALIHSALTCQLSFSGEPKHAARFVCSDEDAAAFVESSIHLRNHSLRKAKLSLDLQQQMDIAAKLARLQQKRLTNMIVSGSRGMTMAVERLYATRVSASKWVALPQFENMWLSNFCETGAQQAAQSIFYNVLTGELLLNGAPLGHLPGEYLQDPLYKSLFGSRIITVASSSHSNMTYQSMNEFSGHQVHFGFRDGNLIVQAIFRNRLLRIIPRSAFRGDLPDIMVDDFVHWLDVKTGRVDFRSLNEPWKTISPSKGITLHFKSSESSYLVYGDRTLVDNCKGLGKSIVKILEVLERSRGIVITTKGTGIDIDIPRCGLKFYVDGNGGLCSVDFAANVESEQTIGCFVGLNNKLVLKRNRVHASLPPERIVLVPHGSIIVTKDGQFSRVTIQTDEEKKVRVMFYELDAKLSKLRNAPGIVSTLYRAYLHAVTSSPAPDPLTRLPGVQQALQILQEQSLFTSSPLEDEAMLLLNLLAELTPNRVFYPANRQEMQVTRWNPNVSQLVQDEAFFVMASKIVEHSSKFASFYDDLKDSRTKFVNRGDQELLQRSFARNRGHHGSGARTTSSLDRAYHPRDSGQNSDGAARAYEVATLIQEWPANSDIINNFVKHMRSQKCVSGYGRPLEFGPMSLNALLCLPVQRQWGSAYDLCRSISRSSDSFQLLFNFSIMAFSHPESMPIIRTLLAVAFSGKFKDLKPESNDYDLEKGEVPEEEKLRSAVNAHCHAPQTPPTNESLELQAKRGRKYQADRQKQVEVVVQHLIGQFPPKNDLTLPSEELIPLINGDAAVEACKPLFSQWHRNHKFILHLEKVEVVLRKIQTTDGKPPPQKRRGYRGEARDPEITDCTEAPIAPNLIDLMIKRPAPPPIEMPHAFVATRVFASSGVESGNTDKLRIISDMRNSSDSTRKSFGNDLYSSNLALEKARAPKTPKTIAVEEVILVAHREDLQKLVHAAFKDIVNVLMPEEGSRSAALEQVGLWPLAKLPYLLAFLSGKKINALPHTWKDALLALGQGVAMLQRSERLLSLKYSNDVVAFYKEAEDPGHANWVPADFPDWLLIEIENNLTIRKVQATVAMKMLRPDNGQNSLLQLNMGEGKSSVIVPMLLTAMSDGALLSRLIVLKPLLRQTERLLSERLGGLVDRRIYHIPFSRKTHVTEQELQKLEAMYIECVVQRGVVIALPEHILSYRLHSRERLLKDSELGKMMITLESKLQSHCRDIMDESDQLLDSKSQLVYSIGAQQMMDGQPDRWMITQATLALLAQEAESLSAEYPEKLQLERNGRSFPFVNFLDSAIGPLLLDRMVESISQGALPEISLSHCSSEVRAMALNFIRQRHLPVSSFKRLEHEFGDTVLWPRLHLVRGLIAFNVLIFAFQQKRWLVDYGLDLKRCMMAVPYRAKGIPSLASEFGHPDVAIVLTCLSYYHGGLNEQQLRLTLELLVRQPDALSEYAQWWHGQDIPEGIRNLAGINLEDNDLWNNEIYPRLRFSKVAADSFLNRVVFPHEGKEFPMKLSASAWDLLHSDESKNATTGFSGTNDSKSLLPLSIKQKDLPELTHTNAMVVDMILQKENRGYVEAKTPGGKRLDVTGLLTLISGQSPRIQVLLDVGAQVLELGNLDVARTWLELDGSKAAAVYFDANDEAMVVDKQGHIESLLISPFNHKAADCLFYFDEVHTRGIDVRMAVAARAAVTLGPTLVRDKFVQACGRMRRLGGTQTLCFFSPPEVHEAILAATAKPRGSSLDSADVMAWCFEQTCRAIDSMRPLYLMHGLEFSYRQSICAEFKKIQGPNDAACSTFATTIQEPESKTLEQMYSIPSETATFRSCIIDKQAQSNPVVMQLLGMWESSKQNSEIEWSVQEEQEREISHEIEQEKQVEKPPKASALRHEIDGALPNFVATGSFSNNSSPFRPIFEGTANTTAQKCFPKMTIRRNSLFLSKDFVSTVKLSKGMMNDQFIRPVTWVLSNGPIAGSDTSLIVISPFEANALLPEIQASKAVSLHMFSAKTSRTMKSFSDLSYFTIGDYLKPPSLLQAAQLDLFAGTVYFESHNAYKAVCDFLGILTSASLNVEDLLSVGNDGFVSRESRDLIPWAIDCPFEQSPIVYINALVGLRRKGMRFTHSHLGQLLEGHILTSAHFKLPNGTHA